MKNYGLFFIVKPRKKLFRKREEPKYVFYKAYYTYEEAIQAVAEDNELKEIWVGLRDSTEVMIITLD